VHGRFTLSLFFRLVHGRFTLSLFFRLDVGVGGHFKPYRRRAKYQLYGSQTATEVNCAKSGRVTHNF